MTGNRSSNDENTAIGANGPDNATVLKFAQAAISARTKYEEAHEVAKSEKGVYRSILKAAKQAGVMQNVLVRVMDDRLRDEAVVIAEERCYIRYASLMNMPIHQSDLFADVGGVDALTILDQQMFDAADAGIRAGKAGQTIDDNPWDPQRESELFTEWRTGWNRGRASMAKAGASRPTASARRGKQNGAQHANA